jgi:hypothetical protein
VGEQPPGGRLESRRRQAVPEIRLEEPDDPVAGHRDGVAEPRQALLIARGQQDEHIGGRVPAADERGMGDGQVERRVCGLTRLSAGR